jgi:hypothetical protein
MEVNIKKDNGIVNQSKHGCQVFCETIDVCLPVKNTIKVNSFTQPNICMLCDESKLEERGFMPVNDLIFKELSETNRKHNSFAKFSFCN